MTHYTCADFIWRIEDKNGKGAYTYLCYGEGNYYGPYHPAPSLDEELNPADWTPEHIFGFESILTARRWFCSMHDLMDWERAHGAVLVVYLSHEVSRISHGKDQMIFRPFDEDGKKVTPIKLPASDLHRLRVSELEAKVRAAFEDRDRKPLASQTCMVDNMIAL